MTFLGKGFKAPEGAGEMNSMPVGEGSHCVEGAAANAEARFARIGRVSGFELSAGIRCNEAKRDCTIPQCRPKGCGQPTVRGD